MVRDRGGMADLSQNGLPEMVRTSRFLMILH